MAWQHAEARHWTAETPAATTPSFAPLVSIVTLPPEQPLPGRPPGRAHHALSFNNDGPKRALRSLGLEVTECSTRLRLPSRLRQDTPGGPTTLEAQAQVSWMCRF